MYREIVENLTFRHLLQEKLRNYLHNNDRPPKPQTIQNLLGSINWEVLHPPYNPYLYSRDFYGFGPLKGITKQEEVHFGRQGRGGTLPAEIPDSCLKFNGSLF